MGLSALIGLQVGVVGNDWLFGIGLAMSATLIIGFIGFQTYQFVVYAEAPDLEYTAMLALLTILPMGVYIAIVAVTMLL